MGLDMYLERYPRYKDIRPENIHALEAWVEWRNDPKSANYTFQEYTGMDESLLPNAKDGEYLKQFISTKYWAWDTEHRFPHDRIYEQVAYWRKSNAIHKWFVDHVQGGKDDCEYHDEVTKELLEDLVSICKEICEKAVLAKGKITNGYRIGENLEKIPIYVDGLKVINPEVCEELLPTQDGFFFGGTEYSEYYMRDIRETYETLTKVLEETDFEKQMLFYCSSW